MVTVTIIGGALTSCNDNEPVEEVTYSWEFEEVTPSTPDFKDDKNKIESAFKTAFGSSGSATSVTRQGTSETCDQEMLEACQQALESLKGEVWQGRYTFTVNNVTTGTMIFIHTFNTDNENSGTYTASDLKMGDYYYSDGTWSDGGLRETFKVPDNALFYWSSTEAEDSYGSDNAWIVVFDSGIAGPMKKDFAIGYVRAILAF